jgi:hypothetical protein
LRSISFERPFAPHGLAPRRLDQNHLGAKIGKEQATVTSPAAGEVENPQS